MSKMALYQDDEDDGGLQMSLSAKIADVLKSKCVIEYTFLSGSVVNISSSAGAFALLGDVFYIQMMFGAPFTDEHGSGYDAHQTEYFRPDDYNLASKAFVLRCNSKSPEKATGLGSTLEEISQHCKANDPLLKARSFLLIAWSGEKSKGAATERTVGLAALINDLDTLYAIPDAAAVKEDWKAEVKKLMNNRQEIAAIKLYRAKSGLGLREAQFAVNNMKSKEI